MQPDWPSRVSRNRPNVSTFRPIFGPAGGRSAEMTTVRAAVTQVAWTGDKETMIERHEELAREAAADGVQIIGFQELFYGPYFGAVQDQKYYEYVEPIP